jgi:hypothetical protein
MLEWWKDLFRPIRLSDPRFGELRYLRDARFWEGRAPFQPADGQVEVLIQGSASGPTDAQRSFFDEIERRYSELWPAVQASLVSESRRAELVPSAFRLVCVDIPQTPSPTAEWQLSYETRPPSWHFTVNMRGWQAQDVLAEC